MKRSYTAFPITVALGILWSTPAFPAIDPRDSVILESKSLQPSVGHPAALIRVYITNKDSLVAYVFSLVEKTLTGSAYMTLPHARDDFDSVAIRLTQTLGDYKILTDTKYNSTSPDTFIISGFLTSLNPAKIEPPNAVRKPFLDIRFDSVRTDSGRIAFDSARIVGNYRRILATGFVDIGYNDVPVNFVKGVITVDPTAPSVTVTVPNGGEYASKPCPPFTITWNATDNVGVTGVEIRLDRTNDGIFEQQIANLNGNPGLYDWAPSGTNSTNAKMKVTAMDAAGNAGSDVSNGTFTIGQYCPAKPLTNFDINNDGVVSLVDVILFINQVRMETDESLVNSNRAYIQNMLSAIFSSSP